jgi:NitT/TauT family transport system substrate-binding protein
MPRSCRFEKKYLASNPELNATALSHLNYLPSILRAESSVRKAAEEMKKAGMLVPGTDPAKLAKRAFIHLNGVIDEWIEKTEVKMVAGGQILPSQDAATLASVIAWKVDRSCCAMLVIH